MFGSSQLPGASSVKLQPACAKWQPRRVKKEMAQQTKPNSEQSAFGTVGLTLRARDYIRATAAYKTDPWAV